MSLLTIASYVYGNAWGTKQTRMLFSDAFRVGEWLRILAVLAKCQAAHGLIPVAAANEIGRACASVEVNTEVLESLRTDYEVSGHSTYGLLQLLKKRCNGDAAEWVCFGATVQDVTDTWMMLTLKRTRQVICDDLRRLHDSLLILCKAHRDTVMAGRTHGQQGLPITFGYKVASWIAEVRRNMKRLEAYGAIGEVGQLSGAVGSLSGQGAKAFDIQTTFCVELGLNVPDMSWGNSRDLILEWANVIALAVGTADRICREIYNLQRTEIDELREGFVRGTVGSITMPHKRNPEMSEHVGTLSRIVRANVSMLAEGAVHEHERDGRSWKVEWHAIPEIAMAAAKALMIVADLVEKLQVDSKRMQENLLSSRGYIFSEAVMIKLAAKMGRASVYKAVYDLSMQARERQIHFKDALLSSELILTFMSAAEIEELFNPNAHVAHCHSLVDRTLNNITLSSHI